MGWLSNEDDNGDGPVLIYKIIITVIMNMIRNIVISSYDDNDNDNGDGLGHGHGNDDNDDDDNNEMMFRHQ